MNYVITKLVTENGESAFSLLGVTPDLKKAAAIAAKAYKAYNQNASTQNVALITEWLETRHKHSFRKDKDHRLQLAITKLESEEQPEDQQLIYSASAEKDALNLRMSQVLFEGQSAAIRRPDGTTVSCPMEKE